MRIPDLDRYPRDTVVTEIYIPYVVRLNGAVHTYPAR